jgi:hypothetical protein
MADSRGVFEKIVQDLGILRDAYGEAGLLRSDAARDPAVRRLVEGESIDGFQRDFFLFDAVIRNRLGQRVHGRFPTRHIAVFGANNVGKSTVVNLLLAERLAAVSVEGGFTRHPQAFAYRPPPWFGGNPLAFDGFASLPTDRLRSDMFDAYGFAMVSSRAFPDDVVLWDTPDCDAIGSGRYLRGVLEALAAADLVLYVTTPDRYAQERPVEWLSRLIEAGLPVVECFNKSPADIFDRIVARQATLFAEMADGPVTDFPIVRIGLAADDGGAGTVAENADAAAVRRALLAALERIDRAAVPAAALAYLRRHVAQILRPVRMETTARRRWAAEVEDAVNDFADSYDKGYLTSDQAIDPFTRLNLEILQLLDPRIPGLKQAMTGLRWITRWPAKLLLLAGRRISTLALSGGATADDAKLPPELKVYADAHAAVLNRLSERISAELAETPHHPFWEALDREWLAQLKALSEAFGAAAARHMDMTDQTIKSAAADIYERLRAQPLLLSALRAVRVTVNVAGALVGFVVPVKGGMAFDLLEEGVLAPLLITMSEGATSSMVESYVAERRRKIVATLRDDARRMGEEIYRRRLMDLADAALSRTRTLGLDDAVLERLPANLELLAAQSKAGRA